MKLRNSSGLSLVDLITVSSVRNLRNVGAAYQSSLCTFLLWCLLTWI